MKHYDSVEVGKRIKDIRKKAGIKQIKLAEEMHISNDMLSRIENGKNTCAPDHLMFLCQRFNKTSDYFYFGLGQFTRNYTQTTKRGLLTTNKG